MKRGGKDIIDQDTTLGKRKALSEAIEDEEEDKDNQEMDDDEQEEGGFYEYKADFRDWSKDVDPSKDTATIFTIKLVWHYRVSVTFEILLHYKKETLQTTSRLRFEIGREGLQRVLAIALTYWNWTLEHLYRADLPDHCPVQVLFGSSFDPANFEIENCPFFFYSLNDLDLRIGDRIKISHDLGIVNIHRSHT